MKVFKASDIAYRLLVAERVVEHLVDPPRFVDNRLFERFGRLNAKRHTSRLHAAIHCIFQVIGQTRPYRFEGIRFYQDGNFATGHVIFSGATNQAHAKRIDGSEVFANDSSRPSVTRVELFQIEMRNGIKAFAAQNGLALPPQFESQRRFLRRRSDLEFDNCLRTIVERDDGIELGAF